MADLLWPGDERAGDVFTDASYLTAMVRVEQAWLDGLVAAGLATGPRVGLTVPSLADVAAGTESGGNPVIPLVKALRSQHADVHRGLTSQDVVDTALVLCLRDAVDRVLADAQRAAVALARLAREHRGTLMVGRTLTQYAVPITFGLKAATWLSGLDEAVRGLRRVREELPIQVGGAAGTLAAVVELARDEADPVGTAVGLVRALKEALDLQGGARWHTRRTPLTATADALVTLGDALGHLGGDVALLSRPEIGELREGAGGGSSTMPGKANPVLSILLQRHALAAPALAGTMHVAAGTYVDERPAGGWHAEWDTLRLLGRRSVVAASQAADLLEGLVVDTDAMAARVAATEETLTAEQRSISGDGTSASAYLGANDLFIDNILERAARVWSNL